MVGEDIKKSVLDSAIRGNLVENNLKLKPIIEENTYKRIPYEIPENWRWCKIGDFLSVETGLAYSKSDQTTQRENTIRVLRGGNINNQFQYVLKEDDVYVKNVEKYKELKVGDILTPSVTSMEQIGKTAYIDKELPNISAGGFVYMMRSINKDVLDPKYALYFISSNFHKEMCKPNINKSGQAFYNLKKTGLIEQPIAIPPIEEQRAIVDKIEKIFCINNQILELEEQKLELDNELSQDIKKSVLDSAIRGNLVENNLKLKPIIEENTYKRIPYEIPENWRWCKIGDFLSVETGLAYSKSDQTTQRENTIRVLRGGNINNQFQYVLKEDDVYVKNVEKYKELKVGDILTPSVTSMEQIGKTAYIDKELPNISAGGFVYMMRSINKDVLDPKYALYFISSNFHKEMCKPNINKSGQAFYNLKKTGLIEQPIAIPPIEEQRAIVDKIEKIFSISLEVKL